MSTISQALCGENRFSTYGILSFASFANGKKEEVEKVIQISYDGAHYSLYALPMRQNHLEDIFSKGISIKFKKNKSSLYFILSKSFFLRYTAKEIGIYFVRKLRK